MTLSDIFMPMPAGGRRGEGVSPLGIWEKADAEDEARERRRAAWRRYAQANAEKCKARVMAWRQAQREKRGQDK
jgi:hypothetical protein